MLARMPVLVAGLLSSIIPAATTTVPRRTAPTPPIQPISHHQAAMIVLRRPEMGELAHRIEAASHGQVRLAIMHDGERPRSIQGVRFWVIGVYERHASTLPRRGTLLVRVRDGELFAQEISTSRIVTFRDWVRRMGLTYHAKPAPKPVAKPVAKSSAKSAARSPAAARQPAAHRPSPLRKLPSPVPAARS